MLTRKAIHLGYLCNVRCDVYIQPDEDCFHTFFRKRTLWSLCHCASMRFEVILFDRHNVNCFTRIFTFMQTRLTCMHIHRIFDAHCRVVSILPIGLTIQNCYLQKPFTFHFSYQSHWCYWHFVRCHLSAGNLCLNLPPSCGSLNLSSLHNLHTACKCYNDPIH